MLNVPLQRLTAHRKGRAPASPALSVFPYRALQGAPEDATAEGAIRVERAPAAEFTEEERAALVGLLARCVNLLEKERNG